jgi:plastocyanin
VRTRLAATVGGALIAAVAVACGAAAASVSSTKLEIGMRGNSYSPRRAEITLGDTVVWVNKDIVRHDATKAGLFDSGELTGGERYEWVPADTGLVEYRCTIHQRMRGQIRVIPKQ